MPIQLPIADMFLWDGLTSVELGIKDKFWLCSMPLFDCEIQSITSVLMVDPRMRDSKAHSADHISPWVRAPYVQSIPRCFRSSGRFPSGNFHIFQNPGLFLPILSFSVVSWKRASSAYRPIRHTDCLIGLKLVFNTS